MTWLKEKIPLFGFAIANAIFINLIDSSDTIIISILLLISGYIIYRIYDIFGFSTDGYISRDSLFFIGTIIALCIYCTAITVINTGYIAFIPLAIINMVSGYFAAYTKYSYFDDSTYEDYMYEYEEEDDDDDSTEDNDDDCESDDDDNIW